MKETPKSGTKIIWLSAIGFGLVYSVLFYLFKDQLLTTFQQTTQALPIYEFTLNSAFQTQDLAGKYGVYLGGVFLLLALILTPILLFLRKILFLAKYRWSLPIFMFILYGLFGALGVWLVYFEPQVMPISVGVVLFVGTPLLYSSAILLFFSLVYFILTVCKKSPKLNQNAVMVIMLLFLGGCQQGCSLLGGVLEQGCEYSDDSDHCYQKAALANNDPNLCDSIVSGAPRDKCHMMIAMSNGDDSYCDRAQGEAFGYSKDTCISKVQEVEAKQQNEQETFELDGKQLTKNEYFRAKKDVLFEDIDDEDVKIEIAAQFNQYRQQNQAESPDVWVEKLEDIKTDIETLKRLDENANVLLDGLKQQMVDYTDAKQQQAQDYVIETGWNAIKDNQNIKEMERRMQSLEGIKSAYDKGSATYQKINKNLEKIKATYEEVKGIYQKVDAVNQRVQNDEISPGQAEALKGGIFLHEGLKRVTGYIPAFGSTVSTITDETFGVVLKFADTRAGRTHALNKCIEDPEGCDPNGISAY